MMGRRTFLLSTASLLAGLQVSHLFPQALADSTTSGETTDSLAKILGSLEVDIGLGERAASLSAETSVQEALRNIETDCAALSTDEGAMRDCVRSKISADFSQGRIAQIDGWWLSHSEIALWALAYEQGLLRSRIAKEVGYKDASPGEIAKIKNWGPQGTNYGQCYNCQPDGHSALWIVLDKRVPGTTVVLDGRKLKTTENGNTLTTAQYESDEVNELLFAAGEYDVELFNSSKGLRQFVGKFKVGEKPEYLIRPDGIRSEVFCPVTTWGPRRTSAGKPFNPQPNGGSAFWIKTACYPDQVVVRLGESYLNTRKHPNMITAGTLDKTAWSAPGKVPISLFDPESGESYIFGTFEVRP